MRSERMTDMTKEREHTKERKGRYLGRLYDLHLGNPEGIPSAYADKTDTELQKIAQEMADELRLPTDPSTLSCIDGRNRLKNADGSAPEVRLRRAGGTEPNLAVALMAEAPVTNTLDLAAPIAKQAKTIDDFITGVTGFEQSAHMGGCGKANGEVKDLRAIHENPAVLTAVKYVLEIPEVRAYLVDGYENEIHEGESLYDETLAGNVREAAGKAAQFFEQAGWDGQQYVDDVTRMNPRGVEELEVDEEDEQFHGHAESAVIIVLGDETVCVNGFVWNVKATKIIASALAGQRGIEGYKQALIAEVAEAMAVSDRLPSDKTPVLLLDSTAK